MPSGLVVLEAVQFEERDLFGQFVVFSSGPRTSRLIPRD